MVCVIINIPKMPCLALNIALGCWKKLQNILRILIPSQIVGVACRADFFGWVGHCDCFFEFASCGVVKIINFSVGTQKSYLGWGVGFLSKNLSEFYRLLFEDWGASFYKALKNRAIARFFYNLA